MIPDAVTSTPRRILSEFSEKNVTFLAGSIAYSAFVSLVPLLLFVLLAVSVAGSGQLEGQVLELARQYLTPAIGGVLDRMLSTEGVTGASLIGLVTLVWGSLKIFRGLDTAFSEIYESDAENSFVDQLTDGLVVLVSLVVAIAAMVVATAAFAALESIPYVGLLNPLLLVVGLSVAFFPMFYRFPDTDVSPREILPGVLVAAVGWALLQGLFEVYVGFSTGDGEPNIVAGIILLVTWLYFSGVVLLLGAVVNAVLGGHTSGAGGGVGRDAGATETRLESRLNPDELAVYLRDLREDLTGRYEGMAPTSTDGSPRPRPAGDAEVVERSADDGDRWVVHLEWHPDDGDGIERAGGRD